MINYFNPVTIILLPVFGALFILMTKNFYEYVSVVFSIITFFTVLITYFNFYGYLNTKLIFEGFELKFFADELSYTFGFVSMLLWVPTIFYSIGYMRVVENHSLKRFYSAFSIAMSGAAGVAFSANLITSFLFYEIITLSTYPLVIHSENQNAYRAGRIYFVYLISTSIFLFLPAILLIYIYCGTTDFGLIDTSKMPELLKGVVLLMFIFGIAKHAIMPLHSWLPEAMVAPTPVSALLHAVCVVKAGVFLIIRVFLNVFNIETLSSIYISKYAPYLASFTIIAASIIALYQDDLKLRLAYSTVSQLAYVLYGVSFLNEYGIKAAIMQIPAHAFGKITLFFVAGCIYVSQHKKKVSELDGVGYKMPFTMAAFLIGAFSMIGLPLFAGFHPKLNMFFASKDIFIVVPILSSILNTSYFLPVFFKAFSKKEYHIKEAPLLMLIPTLFTATITVFLFFYPNLFYFK
ncbi:MAG: monovalent cation/H+ antiporter subunit D family protein [bacterium]|nr:monovalent cation/H+ antiporter subunit D family protein [bacterium]